MLVVERDGLVAVAQRVYPTIGEIPGLVPRQANQGKTREQKLKGIFARIRENGPIKCPQSLKAVLLKLLILE